MEDAKTYTERSTLERIVKASPATCRCRSRSSRSPARKPPRSPTARRSGPSRKSEIKPEEYTDFYRSVAGQFDEPALTVHFRAEGRHEYTALAFVPGSRPFDLFDPDRKGRIKLYVKRVFITDEAEILPRYLRFVRGLVDSADLPLNVSREMIQESPILAAIRRASPAASSATSKSSPRSDAEAYAKIWDTFGAVLKEGLYEDFERRDALLTLARFKTTAGDDTWRSLKDYVAALKANQTAIYYIAGDDLARLEASPHLEGFRARGIEVLLLTDPVDSFWVTSGVGVRRQAVQVGDAGRGRPGADPACSTPSAGGEPRRPRMRSRTFIAFVKDTLGDAVSDVRASDRLTDSAVCLVAPEPAPTASSKSCWPAPAGWHRRRSRSWRSIRATSSSSRWPRWARTSAPSRKTPRDLLFDEARVLDGERPTDAKHVLGAAGPGAHARPSQARRVRLG